MPRDNVLEGWEDELDENEYYDGKFQENRPSDAPTTEGEKKKRIIKAFDPTIPDTLYYTVNGKTYTVYAVPFPDPSDNNLDCIQLLILNTSDSLVGWRNINYSTYAPDEYLGDIYTTASSKKAVDIFYTKPFWTSFKNGVAKKLADDTNRNNVRRPGDAVPGIFTPEPPPAAKAAPPPPPKKTPPPPPAKVPQPPLPEQSEGKPGLTGAVVAREYIKAVTNAGARRKTRRSRRKTRARKSRRYRK